MLKKTKIGRQFYYIFPMTEKPTFYFLPSNLPERPFSNLEELKILASGLGDPLILHHESAGFAGGGFFRLLNDCNYMLAIGIFF